MVTSIHISLGKDLCSELDNHYLIGKMPTIYENEKEFLEKITYLIDILQRNALILSIEVAFEISKFNEVFDKTSDRTQAKELLSKREKEVLGMMFDGLTNKEIAQKLFISFETVKSHRKKILLKTGSKNTAAITKNLKFSEIEELKR